MFIWHNGLGLTSQESIAEMMDSLVVHVLWSFAAGCFQNYCNAGIERKPRQVEVTHENAFHL